MSNKIPDRLTALRALMKEHGVDAYLVLTDDFHASEYVGEHFKCRAYMTGFTGSAGTLLVTHDMAGLWTDGRYFIQAEQQLIGSGVTLFRMREPGVPSIHEFLKGNLKNGQCLGFDGRTVSAREAAELSNGLAEKNIRIQDDKDLVGEIWKERPALSCEPVHELDIRWTGKTRAEKCHEIRQKMQEKHADVFLLASLDDIAWLLNIRGGDILCNPVVLSFVAMTQDEIFLFANEKAFSAEVKAALLKDGVTLHPYEEVYAYASCIEKGKRVLLCSEKVNSRLTGSIPDGAEILDEENLTLLPKSMKTPVEVENEKIAHIKDGVAVTKFIYWLKQNVGKIPITELSAADYLNKLRAQQEHFMGNSFEPIVSFGPHAAMNHYSATPETDVPIEKQGFLLADTGGQYL